VSVVDASAVISGPLATMMLADQGAEVIKIEPPGIGDIVRTGTFRRGGMVALFANCNRGKRSIVLDLQQQRGREIAYRLIEGADVFVQNWRPGAAERVGLGEDALRGRNSELIYVSISGFGDSGPYRDRRVYDPIIQALSGHAAIQVNPAVPIPDLVRNLVSDKSTAYTAAQAITAALFARERGAGGQHIRVPMLDASLAFFWPDGMMAHTMLGDGVEGGFTLYQIYRLTETEDGHLIYFAASDAEFDALYRALDRSELSQHPDFSHFAGRRARFEELGELLASEFRKRKTAKLLERLVAEQVPVAPVLSLEEVLENEQVRHNEAVFEQTHPSAGTIRQARPAARFDRTPESPGRFPPLHGEHTDEILAELGVDGAEREALHADGVVHAPGRSGAAG
jgi:crotonobetainyl-CoA:carnitine CoA-transferase CaiB-like acyl-CoA transferase